MILIVVSQDSNDSYDGVISRRIAVHAHYYGLLLLLLLYDPCDVN